MALRIRELRKKNNMSQSELAALVGVSTSTIGMYEQIRREPDMTMLIKISQVLNVSVDYLIGESDISTKFDIDDVAKNIAKNLINQPSLMFHAEYYTPQEMDEIAKIIEYSVKIAIDNKLSR